MRDLEFGRSALLGSHDSGQLGNGTATSSSVPVAVSGLTNVVALAAGGTHTCAVRVDGAVWCWGEAIANGKTVATATPSKLNLTRAVRVTAGAGHLCAQLADGSVKCWGQNAYGQLGDGTRNPSNIPVSVSYSSNKVVTALTFVEDISAGGNFTCALASGGLFCWGDNSFGQLGDGGTTSSNEAIHARNMGNGVAALATGGAHSCEIAIDGSAACLGSSSAGQVDGGIFAFTTSILGVPSVARAIEIVAGGKHTCAAIVDGSIRCWGDNTYGQHGDGISGQVGVDSVVGINGTFLARAVTAGNHFTCGRRDTGAAACWGAGVQGQLGDSANVSSPNPVAVTAIANAAAMTAGVRTRAM